MEPLGIIEHRTSVTVGCKSVGGRREVVGVVSEAVRFVIISIVVLIG